jgi:hypothetical protein
MPSLTHGHSRDGVLTRTYRAWKAIKTRCTNPNQKQWKDYGGRGIRMCQEWTDSFEAFYAHIGPAPSDQHTIERKETSKGYEPGNVRWATKLEQARNKRSNRMLTFNGQTRCVTEWGEITGIGGRTLAKRLHDGWSINDALTIPKGCSVGALRLITFDGKTRALHEWGVETTLGGAVIGERLRLGWSVEEALTLPKGTRRRVLP